MKYTAQLLMCLGSIVCSCTSATQLKLNELPSRRFQHNYKGSGLYDHELYRTSGSVTLVARSNKNAIIFRRTDKLAPKGPVSNQKPSSRSGISSTSSNLHLKTTKQPIIASSRNRTTATRTSNSVKDKTEVKRDSCKLVKRGSSTFGHEGDDLPDVVCVKKEWLKTPQARKGTASKIMGIVERQGKAARVINHAIQHPAKAMAAVSEAAANSLAGFTAATFTKDQKAIIPGLCLGCKSLIDSAQKMNQDELDKAKAYDQGTVYGPSFNAMKRGAKIQRVLNAPSDAVSGAYRYAKGVWKSESKKKSGVGSNTISGGVQSTVASTGTQNSVSANTPVGHSIVSPPLLPTSTTTTESLSRLNSWQDLGQDPDVKHAKEIGLTTQLSRTLEHDKKGKS